MSVVKRHFRADPTTTKNALLRLMRKLGAENVTLKQDLLGKSKAAEITFDRTFRGAWDNARRAYDEETRRYHVLVETYEHPEDNLRALYLTLEYQYKIIELYAPQQTSTQLKQSFDRVFGQFEELAPLDATRLLASGGRWWEVLGTSDRPTRAELEHAYRALARLHHPDRGGNGAVMQRINTAYSEGLQALAS